MCYGAFISVVFWGIKGYFLLSQPVEQSGQCITQETPFYFQLWQQHKIQDQEQFTSLAIKWGKESCFIYLKKIVLGPLIEKKKDQHKKSPVWLKQATLKHSADKCSTEAARKSKRGSDSFKQHINAISSFSPDFLTQSSPKFLLFPQQTPKVWLCPQADIFIWK